MKLTEKMSYLKGLIDGLEIDSSTKEGKILLQMSEVMNEMVIYIDDLQSQVDELTELCEILDEDLGMVEEDLYDCDCDSNQTAIDFQTIYKLKTISGYYNFWTKEMLSYQKEIEMFGIPNNYKYYNEDKHLDTITLIKDLGKPVKVLLVKEN